jgi:hypothetical protein
VTSDPPPHEPTSARRRTIDFPRWLRDRGGQKLKPGDAVRVLAGKQQGCLAEVVGWGGERGVEILLDSEIELLAVPARDVEVVDEALTEPAVPGSILIEVPAHTVLLVVPVGGGDIGLRSRCDPGPFPTEASRPTPRAWAEACLAVLESQPHEARTATAARHLHAPMLGRVLDEVLLPVLVHRLAFVVTDDDLPIGELLTLWLLGTAPRRCRQIGEVAAPIVVPRSPDSLDIRPVALGCDEVVVMHLLDAPAVSVAVGTLATLGLAGPDVRDVHLGDELTSVDRDAAQVTGNGHDSGRRRPSAVVQMLADLAPGRGGLAFDVAPRCSLAVPHRPQAFLGRSAAR